MFPWQKEALEQTSLTAAILVVGDAGIGAANLRWRWRKNFPASKKSTTIPTFCLCAPEKNIIRIRPDGKFKEPTYTTSLSFAP